jgi:hypothetical protein
MINRTIVKPWNEVLWMMVMIGLCLQSYAHEATHGLYCLALISCQYYRLSSQHSREQNSWTYRGGSTGLLWRWEHNCSRECVERFSPGTKSLHRFSHLAILIFSPQSAVFWKHLFYGYDVNVERGSYSLGPIQRSFSHAVDQSQHWFFLTTLVE